MGRSTHKNQFNVGTVVPYSTVLQYSTDQIGSCAQDKSTNHATDI